MDARILQDLDRLDEELAGVDAYTCNKRGGSADKGHTQVLVQFIGLCYPYNITGCEQQQRAGGKMIIGQVDGAVNRPFDAVCSQIAVHAERITQIGILGFLHQTRNKEVVTYAKRYSGGHHLLDFGRRDKRF